MKKMIVIYLKNHKKPFEIEFENKQLLTEFYDSLQTQEIIKVGPLVFSKSSLDYCVER